MRRWIAVLWHASFFVLAAALYFFFVLPRWFELTGAWPVGLGLAMRLVCGALIGLAALPVLFTLLRTRRPEFGTPKLALTLRFWSVVLHVLAAALIAGAAISEIWVSLDAAGQTLFGIYGAAAAVTVLAAVGFYLAFAAELPPPPPKPLRPKNRTRRRGRDDVPAETSDPEPAETSDDETSDAESADPGEEASEVDETPTPVTLTKSEKSGEAGEADGVGEVDDNGSGNTEQPDSDEPGSTLRNRRPSGKSNARLFGRSRRGVALDD